MTVFIDDFSIHLKREDHLYWIRECLIWCCNTQIAINPDKLFVAVIRGVLLGHIVSEVGIEPDPEKVEVINNLKPPTTVKKVQKVLDQSVRTAHESKIMLLQHFHWQTSSRKMWSLNGHRNVK